MDLSQPKVVFINDTSLFSNHFGCELVGQTFREQFRRTALDLVLSLPKRFDAEKYRDVFEAADLIVINGEGTFHHDKFRNVLELAEKYPTVLVNCVYEQNSPNPALKKLLYCSARESYSAAEIRKEGVECDVVPDMLFNATFPRAFPRSKPKKKLGITDNVVKEYHGVWPLRWRVKGFKTIGLTPGGYISKLTSYERVAVGRFHAAVLCSVFNIPFASWDSNTWKTRALMEDMGVPELHFDSRKEAISNVPEALPACVAEFVQNARIRIDKLFDRIHEIAVEQQKRK